ncbi:hypothetical protein GCM10010255_76610 [Streptomyces coeruleofuscus]|uniref:Uncharacterized protein n=1 Tax=Streptomyces coeruleofuscus TaxID=66879 RepID=A0ABP5WDG5_9ACTN
MQRGQRLARLGAEGPGGAPARTGPARGHRVQFRHHTRPACSDHRSVPRASRLDHCVHHRRPHRQPRSYPQAAPNACVKDTTVVHTFAGGPARFRPVATGAYTGTGIFRERMKVSVPFPVDLDLTGIKPRRQSGE